jgi:HemK-related putative methylase
MTNLPPELEAILSNTPVHYEGIDLLIPIQLYSPAEDTDLCKFGIDREFDRLTHIPKQKITILEIGCGPGTLSIYLAKKWKSRIKNSNIECAIIGLDINPLAVTTAEYNAQINGVAEICNFYYSDLFSYFTDRGDNTSKFDFIIFNPPYLPGEPDLINQNTRQLDDATWEGGERGDEITLRFLSFLQPYLHQDGVFLFIGSSAVDQTNIFQITHQAGFKLDRIASKHIFFEDIWLYRGVFIQK